MLDLQFVVGCVETLYVAESLREAQDHARRHVFGGLWWAMSAWRREARAIQFTNENAGILASAADSLVSVSIPGEDAPRRYLSAFEAVAGLAEYFCAVAEGVLFRGRIGGRDAQAYLDQEEETEARSILFQPHRGSSERERTLVRGDELPDWKAGDFHAFLWSRSTVATLLEAFEGIDLGWIDLQAQREFYRLLGRYTDHPAEAQQLIDAAHEQCGVNRGQLFMLDPGEGPPSIVPNERETIILAVLADRPRNSLRMTQLAVADALRDRFGDLFGDFNGALKTTLSTMVKARWLVSGQGRASEGYRAMPEGLAALSRSPHQALLRQHPPKGQD